MAEGSKKAEANEYAPTALQVALGVMILGASAGLTLYTKKTGTMLRQMEKVAENQAKRKGPPKFGPPTKEEWEKIRPRLNDDDLF
mmetsp:Transcript_16432/g.33665  ORF Transcript_16432/g.33665 Transcript_16432/m.33665 type:complete len:85 (+) Transcript_16432:130-384(+)|eukprot:CAMPEP_0183309046 /NCGR_PEP_ID=MMETSP0160_2-20130417/23699_1 /TAXON_ID=2839 ORGANISM="Odontella Sinensis, Strain Grunow 1884" /NCGR_SAMPLE_ID=MMETSP0160_2 /ASSEMBLY_ACC=CAM_ASM_000250 /LENGTH=84 /DNA_ID=CAMNT_0025472991 /DNA_START=110 /DNA_END=364 /DNA_ORIENTATION=+